MRRWLLKALRVLVPLALLAILAVAAFSTRAAGRIESLLGLGKPSIKVGLLHSQTGAMAVSEKSLIDSEVMALEEINAGGGLLGRRVEWVIADGKSEPSTFAAQARRLIDEDGVVAIFGCWTAESRKAARAVVEEREGLLFFPGTFEGIEASDRIIYVGGSSNQSAVPSIRWCVDARKARRFFVVGTEELWSRCTAEILKDSVKAAGAEVVGEASLPLLGAKVGPAIEAIKAARPDFVLNAIIGDRNEDFYAALRPAELTPDNCPVMAFGFGEDELRRFKPADVAGHYAAMNYFQSVDRPENRAFVRKFKARHGEDRATGDPIVAAYNGIKLWAQAVDEAGVIDPKVVIHHLDRQSVDAPEGIVTIDADLRIAWRPFYLGRARADGQFDVVWSLTKPVRPVLFVATRPRAKWLEFFAEAQARRGLGRKPGDVAPPAEVAAPR